MKEISSCGSAYRDPKNPAGDHMPVPVWESQAASVRSRLAKEPHFDKTVSDYDLLCQHEGQDSLSASTNTLFGVVYLRQVEIEVKGSCP